MVDSELDFVVSGRPHTGDVVTFRLRGTVPFHFELSSNQSLDESAGHVEKHIKIVQDKINSPETVFHIDQSGVLLKEIVHSESVSLTDSVPCSNLYDHIRTEGDGFNIKPTKKEKAACRKDNVQVSIMFMLSPVPGIGSLVPDCVPLIHHEHRGYRAVSVDLPLDVIISVASSTPVGYLLDVFRQAVCRQLVASHRCLSVFQANAKIYTPVPHHFSLPNIDTFITILYPEGIEERALEPHRRKLHDKLGLPADRPLLKRSNAVKFPEDLTDDGYLTNTHIGLSPSGVKEGIPYLVSGTYAYHHYMQDRFNDDKWGCAYRSLQTLVSWFRHQAYTDRPIPSHVDIQQALVDMGDKEPTFVGSRQWIGSTEVTSKIMFVNSGSELGSKGRELAQHFETQGTPIMIGGGVLAHTILGIDFNEVTGDLKFLILDPHYTGSENLKTIQDKGWCGWKGPDFWDKNAYYNLCMPQRPIAI